MSEVPNEIVAFISRFERDREIIKIYGSPAGLRWLAASIMELADIDQSAMADDRLPISEGEHWHFKPHDLKDGRGDLLPESSEIIIGRLDAKGTGSFAWVLKPISQ